MRLSKGERGKEEGGGQYFHGAEIYLSVPRTLKRHVHFYFPFQTLPNDSTSRVLCKYVVKLAPSEAATPDSPSNSTSSTNLPPTPPVPREFRISQLARNRIASVCNLLNYLDYIKKGLVKSHVNDVYREILSLRKGIALARLGYSPD